MKRLVYILIVALMMPMAIFAQKKLTSEQEEQLFQARVQMMQRDLKLSAKQLEDFIPVYRDYVKKVTKLRPAKVKGVPKMQQGKQKKEALKNLTSEQAYMLSVAQLDLQREILDAQQKALKSLCDVLTPVQLLEFTKVENDFGRRMMNRRNIGGRRTPEGARPDGPRPEDPRPDGPRHDAPFSDD